MGTPPPLEVVDAFGGWSEPAALVGGEGVSFRAGDIVVKRVQDEAESAWVQATLAAIEEDGFRVARPLGTTSGGWVHDHWIANEFIPGLRPAAPRWSDIMECGLRFGDAADRARPRDTAPLESRTHRWAIADRAAWRETDVRLSPEADAVRTGLERLMTPGRGAERRFVHGDLLGNVFVDDNDQLTVLDVSPYLRPHRWAAAVVVADAVLWNSADLSLAVNFAVDPADRDLLGRALDYRLVAEQLATTPRHGGLLAPYRQVLDRIA